MLQPVEDLVRSLSRLPGLGHRSAGRAALALLREPERMLDPLVSSLKSAREEVTCCSRCGAFTVRGADPCALCSDPSRDGSLVCVVEEPADVVALESAGTIRGRYHVLGGKLSPVRRLGPDRLRIAELVERAQSEGFKEILLALSTDMEGDATAGYLVELFRDTPVKLTRLAFGLPVDSGVGYSDPLTLRRAFQNRVTA